MAGRTRAQEAAVEQFVSKTLLLFSQCSHRKKTGKLLPFPGSTILILAPFLSPLSSPFPSFSCPSKKGGGEEGGRSEGKNIGKTLVHTNL